jgi:hypothetical protein
MAHNVLILSPRRDKGLRKISKEKTTATIWLKLVNLYMTKSLANRPHIKAIHIQDGRRNKDGGSLWMNSTM